MKKIFNWLRDNAFLIIVFAIPIAIPVVSLVIGIYSSFDYIVDFLTKVGFGYWIVGLIVVPLAIIALIQIFRGAFLLLEVDDDIFRLNKKNQDWRVSLYVAINYLGYAALLILLTRI